MSQRPLRSSLKPLSRPASPATQVSKANIQGGTLRVGSRVRHERFGTGTVRELTNQGGTEKACIAFDQAGEKTLLLRFAHLEILS